MAEAFLGEIKVISWNFPPKGWTFCNGQLLPINQNQALFALLGTTYGGDGRTNFALPNLQGRVPIHMGNGFTEGEAGGQTAHTLSISELPIHTHSINASSDAGSTTVPSTDKILASSLNQTYRAPDAALTSFLPSSISNVGGSQPHENMSPYLVLNFIIALQGIFPSQT